METCNPCENTIPMNECGWNKYIEQGWNRSERNMLVRKAGTFAHLEMCIFSLSICRHSETNQFWEPSRIKCWKWIVFVIFSVFIDEVTLSTYYSEEQLTYLYRPVVGPKTKLVWVDYLFSVVRKWSSNASLRNFLVHL